MHNVAASARERKGENVSGRDDARKSMQQSYAKCKSSGRQAESKAFATWKMQQVL